MSAMVPWMVTCTSVYHGSASGATSKLLEPSNYSLKVVSVTSLTTEVYGTVLKT